VGACNPTPFPTHLENPMEFRQTGVALPQYATIGSAAFDIVTLDKARLRTGQRKKLRTGLYLDPSKSGPDECLLILSRSGLADKEGLIVLNAPGLVDKDFAGEICVLVINLGHNGLNIEPGMKIAQGLVVNYQEMAGIARANTVRAGGFGSTGK